jgi:hypothetical protein
MGAGMSGQIQDTGLLSRIAALSVARLESRGQHGEAEKIRQTLAAFQNDNARADNVIAFPLDRLQGDRQ